MAHKTKINGTAYEVTGGRTKINGTAYEIVGGKTKVNGTAYDISFGPPLITFYVSNNGRVTTWQAEEGMTWGDFLNSSYSAGHRYTIDGTFVKAGNLYVGYQTTSNVLVDGKTYYCST